MIYPRLGRQIATSIRERVQTRTDAHLGHPGRLSKPILIDTLARAFENGGTASRDEVVLSILGAPLAQPTSGDPRQRTSASTSASIFLARGRPTRPGMNAVR